MWVTTSDDNGNTWTPPKQINTDPYPYASSYGKIVCLSDGTLLMNMYGWYMPRAKAQSCLRTRGDTSAACPGPPTTE